MKLILTTLLASLLLLTSGCITGTGQISKIVTALGKDPATVHIRVSSVYGVFEFSRTNPGTNTLNHTVETDGAITVGKK